MSDIPPTTSGHPRARDAPRGRKGTRNFLSSSRPRTRGTRYIRGGGATTPALSRSSVTCSSSFCTTMDLLNSTVPWTLLVPEA
jgi:hypothetical protein